MVRFLILCMLLLTGCSCGSRSRSVLRVGVDPNWYPIDFGAQTSYVNGYTEDLLLEIARYSGLEFERVTANWDTLMEGLNQKKYDAVLSSMQPYVFNTAKYDFSGNFLDLGPVLIVPIHAQQADLAKMKGELIGIIAGDPAIVHLEKYPSLIVRNYSAIPDLLNALVRGDIQGAVLDRIPALNYVSDLYSGQLQIIGAPLNDKGLRLVAPKGRSRFVVLFNKSLEALQKRQAVEKLQKKWQLH